MNDFFDSNDVDEAFARGEHTAAICRGGDVMTWCIETEGKPKGFGCPECGEEILCACPASECGKPPGEFNRNTWKGGGGTPPSYCVYCRKPYPWTAKRIADMHRALRLEPEFVELSAQSQQDVIEVANEIASGSLSDAETTTRFRQLRRFPKIADACYHEARDFLSETLGIAIGTMLKP